MSFLPQLPNHSPAEEYETFGDSQRERNLAQLKKARKQIESDAQILANRIALLKQEEMKAWKKIEETKKKTKEVLSIKLANDEKKFTKQMTFATINNKVKNSQVESAELRRQKKIERQALLDSIYDQKHQDVLMMRQQREMNDARKTAFKSRLVEHNRTKSQAVKEHKVVKAVKLQELKETKMNMFRNERVKVLMAEENRKRQKEMEVLNMERLEMELIQKLQKTQMIQRLATEDLANIIAEPRKEFATNTLYRSTSTTGFNDLQGFKTL